MTSSFSWPWELKWVAIAPKPSSILSILACAYVIQRIVMTPNRRSSVYHRLVLAMSTFSLLGSIAAFVGTWAIPAQTPGVYLSSGTDATCSIQGFCIQLFFLGGPLYYSSLSVYYFLIINRGWTEKELKRTEKWLHGIPLSVSASTSIAGAFLNLYHNAQMWCWIAPPANNADAYRMGFFYIPGWVSLLLGTIIMIALVRFVLIQERSTDKYSIRGNGESTTKRRKHVRMVAKQAFAYLAAFYITFIFPSIIRISQMVNVDGSVHFAYIALSAIFAPLGGLFSSLVYLRPQFVRSPGASFSQSLKVSIHNRCIRPVSAFHRNFTSRRSSGKISHDFEEEDIEDQRSESSMNTPRDISKPRRVRLT